MEGGHKLESKRRSEIGEPCIDSMGWEYLVDNFIHELTIRGAKTSESELRWLLENCYALPNSTALLSAGTSFFCGSACTAYPVLDQLHDHRFSVMGSLDLATRALKAGSGVGFNFSALRSRQELVKGKAGITKGPVGVLRSYGGFIRNIDQLYRRPACMGLLHIDHPDVLDFIHSKEYDGDIDCFNISVVVNDAFMDAVAANADYYQQYRTFKGSVRVRAREIFEALCKRMWDNGEPGVVFEDTIRRDYFEANINLLLNPCSESILSHGDDWLEVCVLSSVNLPKYVLLPQEERKHVIDVVVKMLNDVIDVQDYVCYEQRYGTQLRNRKIGIGVAGLATVLALRKIPYGSDNACTTAGQLFAEIANYAVRSSSRLGKVNGLNRYNSSLLALAPTSTLSRIFNHVNTEGCSWGIEPYFDIATHDIKTSNGIVHRREKIGDVLDHVALEQINLAHQLTYLQHLRMLETYYTSAPRGVLQGCSKTINFRNNATLHELEDAIFYCWQHSIKAISFYRDGSRKDQVISLRRDTAQAGGVTSHRADKSMISKESPDKVTNMCPRCSSQLIEIRGCLSCVHCGENACG